MNVFIQPSSKTLPSKKVPPVAMTHDDESSCLSQKLKKNTFPVSYQSISSDTTCGERADVEDDGMLIYPQVTKNTNGRRILIVVTVVLSIIMLSSILLPSITTSHPKVDPFLTGFVGPLSLSMIHRDATTSYYEVLDNSYDVIDGKPVKRVLVTSIRLFRSLSLFPSVVHVVSLPSSHT